MHTADTHCDILPENISAMLMPDSKQEARLLWLCLEVGLYPTETADNDEPESVLERGKCLKGQ